MLSVWTGLTCIPPCRPQFLAVYGGLRLVSAWAPRVVCGGILASYTGTVCFPSTTHWCSCAHACRQYMRTVTHAQPPALQCPTPLTTRCHTLAAQGSHFLRPMRISLALAIAPWFDAALELIGKK